MNHENRNSFKIKDLIDIRPYITQWAKQFKKFT